MLKSAMHDPDGPTKPKKHIHFLEKTELAKAIEERRCAPFLLSLLKVTKEDLAKSMVSLEAVRAEYQRIALEVAKLSVSIFSTKKVPELPPLYIAAGMGDIPSFKLLLKFGATFGELDGPFSKVAMLSIAAYRGLLPMVQYLLKEHGALPDQDYFLAPGLPGDPPLAAAVLGRVHYRRVHYREIIKHGTTVPRDSQHAAVFWELVHSGATKLKVSQVPHRAMNAEALLDDAYERNLLNKADKDAFTIDPAPL